MDGEGNFREFSVTRFLWDTIDTNNDSETITDGFVEMWSALTSPLGFQSSNYHFRSIGLLHAIQDSFTGKTDWDPLRQDSQHLHVLDDNGRTYRHEYALPLSSNCSGMDESITPINDDLDNGSYDTSHLLANNDFFLINHSGGPLSIIMRYQDDDSSGVEVDMDLILYKEKYVIGNEKSMVSKSQLEPDNDPTTQEAEHISVNDLAAGVYLLQIMVYTALFEATIPGTTNYELTYNGSLRCR
jgi:hypothetical protein